MKRFLRCSLSVFLAFLMLIQVCQEGIVLAVDEVDKALNPAERIELTVPEQFQDGGNWFFIPEQGYTASEKSEEKIYIPIQRSGDLEAEADVILKVTDISAKHDVNYTVELYKDDTEPDTVLDDASLVDLIQSADGQEEYEPVADENEFGEIINAAGGAELVDEDGNVIGTVTATPVDENGNPIEDPEDGENVEDAPADAEDAATPVEPPEAKDAEQPEDAETPQDAEPVTPGAAEETDWTDGSLSSTEALRAARNAYTGTVSDRQELSGGDLTDFNAAGMASTMSDEEFDKAMAEAVLEDYPGKEYALHFNAGEQVKFLVITPMYSEAAEGDAQLILMLKDPSEGYEIGEDVNPVSVTILDEDEPEPVTVSMAAETVYAENGVATITVTRQGRINAIKGVTLSSWGGSAKEGDEYSGIGAKLYFPVGITSRTVEIPVYNGTEEKDFYVSITALDDETIGTVTTHVVIPAAETDGDGVLMGISQVNGHPYTDPINLKAGWYDKGGFDSDTSFYLRTSTNTKETVHFWLDTSVYGYAYDGIYLEYDAYLNFCNAEYRLVRWTGSSADRVHTNSITDGGWQRSHWLYSAWNDPKASEKYSIEAANVEYDGFIWNDKYCQMNVKNVRLVKRQFTVNVESAEIMPLIGVKDQDVLNNYEAVFLDKGVDSSRTMWTNDSFTVTAALKKGPLLMVGLEALNPTTNQWVRIVTLDGKSQTAEVTMDLDTVNDLADKGVIDWSTNGKCDHGGSFYKGSITVRPVFEYQSFPLVLQQDPSGEIYMTAPTPNLLWDFNSDNAMNSRMGIGWAPHQVSYTGGKSGSDDYYTFTASGSDPYVSMDTPMLSASDVKWVKIRARTSSSAAKMELLASTGNSGKSIGNTKVPITLATDGQWHEYVVEITNENWKDNIQWLRLDPLEGCKNGDRIDVDYAAFFSDELSARAYRSQSEVHEAGTYTYHLGDKPTFRTEITATGRSSNLKEDGISYKLRKRSDTGYEVDWVDIHYSNGTKQVELLGKDVSGNEVDHPHYTFKPTFTEVGNCVTVEVSKEALSYFDTSRGIFQTGNYVKREESGDNWIYTIQENVLSNVPVELTAYVKDPSNMAAWTRSGETTPKWGPTRSFRTDERAEANRVKLQVWTADGLLSDDGDGVLMADEGFGPTYATVAGTVATETFNLSRERSAKDTLPARYAYVAYGDVGTWTDENGRFELPPIFTMGGGEITYTVTYNGGISIETVTIPGPNAPKTAKVTMDGEAVQAVTANPGVVKVDSFSQEGAHFDSAYFTQEGILGGTINAMFMNGKELTVTVNVAQGEDYVLNGESYSEHVKDVTVYFMDQTTGQIHGMFSSNTTPSDNSPARWSYDDETGVFTLRIYQFDPAHPTEWTYGDVLMARLTTDKQVGISAWTREQGQRTEWDEEAGQWKTVAVSEEPVYMVYEPVSTGIAVASDPDYQPQTFDFDLEDIAGMLGVTPRTDDEGNLMDDNTRYSFGSFPYIGEITAAIHVFSKVASSATASAEMDGIMADLNVMANGGGEGDYEDYAGTGSSGSGGETKNYTLNILLKVDETVWGGVRFMFGVVVSGGGGKGYERQKNPFTNAKTLPQYFADPWTPGNDYLDDIYNYLIQTKDNYDDNDAMRDAKKLRTSSFGGPYFTFSVFVGLYLDYGYVEISTDNGKEKSHDMVFMGAGGFLGFNGSVGYTSAFLIGPVPAYWNVEGGLNVTFFLGSEGNPQMTLQSFKNDSELHGQDFQFNFDFKGRIYLSGTIGVGFYKILGARVSVTLGFEAGYGNNITDWYPNLFDTGWGYTSDITFAGTLDLIFTSIELYSATWPLPLADGFLYYFQEVRRANKCISYVEAGIQKGEGSASDRATAQAMCDELKGLVDANELFSAAGSEEKPNLASVETIKYKTYALKDFAWHADIINWTTKNTIEMNKQAGVIGAIINATTEDDPGVGLSYHTSDHVNSQWVANDGQLMAGYGAVNSTALMENAYAQPSSKIISIGNNKYLMVFLDDTASRDRIQAATLKWTVYDAAHDTWTDPQTVQNDATADSRPSLTDAGDKVILSWASATDAKYSALKAEVATELKAKTGEDPTEAQIQEALEEDPARVMGILDIFTTEFTKASERFGVITQLTDDEDYDDYPQAVYDEDTGDYIVMYYKTAQDAEDYDDPGDKLQDLVGASPDPGKTYSIIAYMLYNNQTGAPDTKGETHEPGWARDYYFPNETAESLEDQAASLARFGGQRFLPSAIMDEDGSYTDPPITDLTVCQGYSGLAAYAFTVDKDFDLKTAEDRELYVQFYDFASHSTFVPIKVAGEITVEQEKFDSNLDDFVTYESRQAVEVGSPKLVRNGGNTYLFWREDGDTLKYLNISEMLNAKVPTKADPGDDDWTWAVKSDGTYATNAATGETYEPRVMKVDFGSLLTDDAIEITDYEVITDEEDNLYVVWTDTVTTDVTNEIGETYPVAAQEIYASGMIHQEKKTLTETDEDGAEITSTTQTARWSKPYRLTRDNAFNDGLALALDSEGNLLIVHNQYTKQMAQSEEDLYRLIEEGKIGVTQDKEGNLYAASISYNSPVRLMVTRFEKTGSLEATAFEFSDYYPVAGETISVTAAIENVGLTDAEGSKIDFYEYKDGVQGELIQSFESSESIPVNTAKAVSFYWTIPDDGPEGYSIQAVIAEQKSAGGYYTGTASYSDAFEESPYYRVAATEAVQEGDQFRIRFTAANAGNADAPEGTALSIRLVGLYGDLSSERYGNLETNVLYSQDITSELKGKTLIEKGEIDKYALSENTVYEGNVLVDIPVSVFKYCGYDAVQVVITDKSGNVIEESGQLLVTLDAPVNLKLNDGESLSLSTGSSRTLALDFDSTVFIEEGTVVYSVEDPTVAVVDADGKLVGVGNGRTTVTATILPSGRTVSIPVTVSGSSITPTPPAQADKICPRDNSCPMTPFTDLDKSAWYHDGVHWAIENSVMNGVGNDLFDPDGVTSRGMIVTMLYRMEGEPAVRSGIPFDDVEQGAWYAAAVSWAESKGIVNGYGDGRFGPNDTLTREQLVTILLRYAQYKGVDTSKGELNPLLDYNDTGDISEWAVKAFRWAVDAGIINGTGSGALSPKQDASRAQVATMLMRYDAKTR